MKIAQLTSNFFSVPPGASKAIFGVVGHLTEGLVDRGHDVTLFASGDSRTKAKLVSVTDIQTSKMNISIPMTKSYLHRLASECYEYAHTFDIIHSHFNIVSGFYSELTSTPTVTTLHSPVTDETRPFLEAFRHHKYISFSHSQRRHMPKLNWVANVYHGIDTGQFAFGDGGGGYLLFIGRLVENKGAHLAIQAAKDLGERIIIAGKSHGHERYWHDKIEPHIDGDQVQYVGEASNEDKIDYFRNAKALLFPVKWEEPFGLVMIEAMACGTPVIGYSRGSVAEIVQHEETGFVVRNVKEMKDAIRNIPTISRDACRERAERFFSLEKMISGYERVYARVIDASTNGK